MIVHIYEASRQKSLRQFLVCSNVTEKNVVEGLNGEGGGSKCQLSVKFLAICQLSVFFSAICQLSAKCLVVSKIAIDDKQIYGL